MQTENDAKMYYEEGFWPNRILYKRWFPARMINDKIKNQDSRTTDLYNSMYNSNNCIKDSTVLKSVRSPENPIHDEQ